jgi:hypothetical protein
LFKISTDFELGCEDVWTALIFRQKASNSVPNKFLSISLTAFVGLLGRRPGFGLDKK